MTKVMFIITIKIVFFNDKIHIHNLLNQGKMKNFVLYIL